MRKRTLISILFLLTSASLACATTGTGPDFQTQVAQTVQAQLEGTREPGDPAAGDPTGGDPIATAVAATIIASGGTPPTQAPTESPPDGQTPTPTPGGEATPIPTDPTITVPAGPPAVDFNGDGRTDLFVSVPGLDNGDTPEAGGFYIFYGGPSGILESTAAFREAQNILPFAVDNVRLGLINAVGDFDADGFSDLALGYPDGLNQDGSGLVALLYGGPNGITNDRLELWDQDARLIEGQGLSPGTLGLVEPGDGFGKSLAAGDFNADGFDDLAIGVPGEDLEVGQNQGAVNVLYGSPTGLTHVGNHLINQNGFFTENNDHDQRWGDLIAAAEDDDAFGTTLAAGDINGDGFDELVVGVPFEAIGDVENAGVVHVIYGSADGLTPAGNQHPHAAGFYTDTDGDGEVDTNVEGGLFGDPEPFGSLGWALAVADLNADGFGDLAVGAPGHSAATIEVSGIEAAGLVHVIFGSAEGLTRENSHAWNQSLAFNIDGASLLGGSLAGGAPEAFDQFGYSLEAADFNLDGFADLAIGSSGESLLADDFSGAISVLYGSPEGLGYEGSQWFSLHDSVDGLGITGPGLVGGLQPEAGFGMVLTSGDYNADGLPDLVIAAPDYPVNASERAGVVYILYSRPGSGLGFESHQQWSAAGAIDATGQLIANLDGPQQDSQRFGGGLR